MGTGDDPPNAIASEDGSGDLASEQVKNLASSAPEQRIANGTTEEERKYDDALDLPIKFTIITIAASPLVFQLVMVLPFIECDQRDQLATFAATYVPLLFIFAWSVFLGNSFFRWYQLKRKEVLAVASTGFYGWYERRLKQYLNEPRYAFQCKFYGMLVILIVGFTAVSFFLALAGVSVLSSEWPWKVKPLDVSVRGNVVSAAAAVTAGIFALATFVFSYHQKNRLQAQQLEKQNVWEQARLEEARAEADRVRDNQNKLEMAKLAEARDEAKRVRENQNRLEQARLEEARDQANTDREHQNKWEQARLDEARAQANYDAIAKEYDALSKDFVSDKVIAQINATIGLAAIAQQVDPREKLKWEQAEAVNREKGLPTEPFASTLENYPWFQRVAAQLANALAVFSDPLAIENTQHSLKTISKWASEQDSSEFQVLLIEALGAVNRYAYSKFRSVIADLEVDTNDDNLFSVAAVISEPISKVDAVLFLRCDGDYGEINDSSSPDFDSIAKAVEAAKPLDDETTEKIDSAWQIISLTRDAIDRALDNESCQLAHEHTAACQRRTLRLNLDHCCLTGTRFIALDLQGSSMRFTNLFGAPLLSTNLSRADLSVAILDKSLIINCDLSGSKLSETNIRRSRLVEIIWPTTCAFWASLEWSEISDCEIDGLTLSFVKLGQATLRDVQIQGGSWGWQQLRSTKFIRGKLENVEIKLSLSDSVSFEGTELSRVKIVTDNEKAFETGLTLTNSSWRHLDFNSLPDERSGKRDGALRDSQLVRILRRRFPNLGPKAGERWPDRKLHKEDYAPQPQTE